MVKKILALVMVVSILGVFAGGCSKGDDASKTDATPSKDGTTTPPATTDTAK